MKKIAPEAGFRTKLEKNVGKRIEKVFLESAGSIESKLENFPKYIKRQKLTRMLALYEIFKKILSVKGSIVECGVYNGFGLMSWANMSAVLEPANLMRRIYGFDTFAGFVDVESKDQGSLMKPKKGQLSSDCYDDLTELIKIY